MRKKAIDLKKITLAGALALVGFFSAFINTTSTVFADDIIVQDTPFIYQNTAGDNISLFYNTTNSADFLEKTGNSIVYNQLVDPENFFQLFPINEDHIYIYSSEITDNLFVIDESADFISLFDENDILIDLTMWFGSNDNIPLDILEFPEEFNRYYRGNYEYNPGIILDSNGRYITSTGRNVYDSAIEYNQVMPGVAYYYNANNNSTISYFDINYNFIFSEVIEPRTTFVTPPNCAYINSSNDSNITITFYISNQAGYNSIYSYETLSEIDTGDEIMRSAGNVRDSKNPDGIITRRIFALDLGTVTWHADEDYPNTFTSSGVYNGLIGANSNNNMLCDIYSIDEGRRQRSNIADKCIAQYARNDVFQIILKDTSYSTPEELSAALSGHYLYYELATYTTEEGTPFSENITIDKLGAMFWTNEDFNGVPQGTTILYNIEDPPTPDPEVPEDSNVSPWSVLIFVLIIIFIISLFTANNRRS